MVVAVVVVVLAVRVTVVVVSTVAVLGTDSVTVVETTVVLQGGVVWIPRRQEILIHGDYENSKSRGTYMSRQF